MTLATFSYNHCQKKVKSDERVLNNSSSAHKYRFHKWTTKYGITALRINMLAIFSNRKLSSTSIYSLSVQSSKSEAIVLSYIYKTPLNLYLICQF